MEKIGTDSEKSFFVPHLGEKLKGVLVIGGAGFLGYGIVQALVQNNCSVRILSLAPDRELDPSIPFTLGDIRNYEEILKAFQGIETVFHVTSLFYPLGFIRRPMKELIYNVNVKGTHNVIKACTECGVKRLIYTSSNNVVFDREIINGDETLPYAEQMIDHYSKTKALAEKAILTANGKGGLLTCALRPGGIYGPGDKTILPRMVKALKKGHLSFTVGGRSALADNVYIDDLVKAHLLAASRLTPDSPVAGQAYFISDGEPTNYFTFMQPLIQKMGFPLPSFSFPVTLCYGFAFISEFFHWLFPSINPILSRMELKNVTITHTFSIEKAKRELGYLPSVNQQEGLKRSLPYCISLLSSIETVERPKMGWWIIILGSFSLLTVLAFNPTAYQFFNQNFLSFFTQIHLKTLFFGALLIHLSEAFYALKVARQKKLQRSASWFLQTLLLGYPSLRLLLRRSGKDKR